MNSYTELDAWKNARKLVKTLYEFCKLFPADEKYGLSNQIKRAVISVPSNIAEGIGRNHTRDTIQFLYISKGSLNELETQIYLAFDLGFCDEQKRDLLLEDIITTRKLLVGFIKYKESKLSPLV
jgi:four helix bundle protein